MSAKDGGPAFPTTGIEHWVGAENLAMAGMSLRDYFAGQALMGYCTGATQIGSFEELAEYAWRAADAMLAAEAPR